MNELCEKMSNLRLSNRISPGIHLYSATGWTFEKQINLVKMSNPNKLTVKGAISTRFDSKKYGGQAIVKIQQPNKVDNEKSKCTAWNMGYVMILSYPLNEVTDVFCITIKNSFSERLFKVT